MRVLILIDDYYPSTKSGPKLVHDLGVQFLRQGHAVSILTPSAAIHNVIEISREDGLKVIRVKTGELKGVSKIRRGWNEVRLSATLWRGARQILKDSPCDVIIYYSPTIFFGRLVRKLKLIWHCPAYLILRDIFPKWALEAGVLRKGLLYWYFRQTELMQYDAADVIGVESPGNLHYFRNELGERGYRVEVLHNWASLDEQPAMSSRFRAALGLENKVVFFYGGNIGIAQDVDNIVRLAIKLKEDNRIFFLLVGEGSEVTRLSKHIADHGLGNIKITGAVPQQEYLAMLNEFDVGIISLNRDLTSHNIPGKLLGYMSCAKPVLASINAGTDLCRLIKEGDAGFCCQNGDDDGLRAAALILANDSHLRKEMGKNSRRLLESRFSDRAAADQIMSHVRPVMSQSGEDIKTG